MKPAAPETCPDDGFAAVLAEYYRADAEKSVDRRAFAAAHADWSDRLSEHWSMADELRSLARAGLEPTERAADGDTAAPTRRLAPGVGERIGPYTLLAEIGRGGMGVVYRARQEPLDRIVALKVMLVGILADDADRQRFWAEAVLAARLRHEGIVTVYDVGEHDGQPYIAMELVEGGTLEQRLQNDGPLPINAAAQLIRDAALAVDHAHAQGVIHRDLKPSNILQGAAGRAKVGDFGLSRTVDSTRSLTLTGQTIGTPSYMPPEQASGASDQVGPRSDVYALGATLYALVTGRPPFRGANMLDTLWQVREAAPTEPRALRGEVPRDLDTIVLHCLEKDPAQRYESAAALADDLDRFLTERPIAARRTTRAERFAKWTRRHPTAFTAAALGLAATALLLTVTTLLIAWSYRGERAARSEAERETGRASAAGREATRQTELARDELARSRRATYNLQLARVGGLWRSDPEQARQLLDDAERCPAELRDFTWGLYRRLCRWGRRELGRHEGGALCVAFSPDGKLLASGGKDNAIRLWDVATGQAVGSLIGHAHWVVALAFSPDGQTLASASRDGTAKLWSVPGGELVATLSDHHERVECVAFSRNGKYLATGGGDGVVRVWDAATRGAVKALGANGCSVTSLAFCRNDATLIVRSKWQQLQLWDWESEGLPADWSAHSGEVEWADWTPTIALSRDESLLAATAREKSLDVWRLNAGNDEPLAKQCTIDLPEPCHVRGISFSGNDEIVAISGSLPSVYLWDVRTGRSLGATPAEPRMIRAAVFSLVAQILAGARDDGVILLWELSPGGPARTMAGFAGSVSSLSVAPSDDLLATAADEPTIRLWNWRTGLAVGQLTGHEATVEGVAFFPDSQRLASSDAAGVIKLWSIGDRRELASVDEHQQKVSVLALSHDGRLLASGGRDRTIRIWDASDLRLIQSLSGHTDSVFALDFSPDDRTLASGSRDQTLRLWDVATGTATGEYREPDGAVGGVVYSPDGQTLAVTPARLAEGGSFSGAVRLLNAMSLAPIRTLHGHTDEVMGMAFSSDGEMLATGSADRSIHLWDAKSGDLRASWGGHDDLVYGVAFTPDGRDLVTNGRDRTVRIWSAEQSGDGEPAAAREFARQASVPEIQPQRMISGHPLGLCDVKFSPDGRQVASCCLDENVYLWDLRAGKLERRIPGHSQHVVRVYYSAEGRALAAMTHERELAIHELPSGTINFRVGNRSKPAGFPVVAPRGDAFVFFLGSGPGPVLWDARRGELQSAATREGDGQRNSPRDGESVILCEGSSYLRRIEIPGLTESASVACRMLLKSASVSRDGRRIVTAGLDQDEPVIVWDLQSLEPIRAIRPDHGQVNAVACSPVADLVACCGEEGRISIWNLITGQQQATLVGHSGAVQAAAWSPDGRTLVSGSGDRTLKAWDLSRFAPSGE